jgi:hypothetical protein
MDDRQDEEWRRYRRARIYPPFIVMRRTHELVWQEKRRYLSPQLSLFSMFHCLTSSEKVSKNSWNIMDATILSLKLLVTANLFPSSLILSTLIRDAIRSSGTSVQTRATRRHISNEDILYFILWTQRQYALPIRRQTLTRLHNFTPHTHTHTHTRS